MATLPALKARMLNRLNWIIGSVTRDSMTTKATSNRTPVVNVASTNGLRQPVGCPPCGWIPEVIAIRIGRQPDGNGDVAPPVDAAAVPFAVVAQPAVGPDGAEDADGHVDPEHRPPVQAASSPPATRPMNWPASAATWLIPSANPRWSAGNASVEDGGRVGRQHGAADGLQQSPADQPFGGGGPRRTGRTDNSTDATVKTVNPRLYTRTRPNMSPIRPTVTTRTAWTSR